MSLTGFNISNQLLKWMEDNLSGTLLELGSGEGTKYLCQHFDKVISIEDNPEYQNLHHDNYICADIVDGWYDVTTVAEGLLGKKYDAILVDAPLGSIGRSGFIKYLKLFDTKVPIIIDDTHRLKERKIFNQLREIFPNKRIQHIKSSDKMASVIW